MKYRRPGYVRLLREACDMQWRSDLALEAAEGLSPGEGGAGQALTLAQAIEQSMQTDDDE